MWRAILNAVLHAGAMGMLQAEAVASRAGHVQVCAWMRTSNNVDWPCMGLLDLRGL